MSALILHCVADKVRLQLVTSKDAYLKEYQRAYGSDAIEKDSLLKEYVNCEDWYTRILCDMKFKNFKKFKLVPLIKQGLWSISTPDGMLADIYEEIHSFIRVKIMSYNEDENDTSFLDNLLKVPWTSSEDASPINRLNNEAFVYALKFTDVAQDDQGLYVPSYKQWQQLIFELLPFRKIDKSHMDLLLFLPAWKKLDDQEKKKLSIHLPETDLVITRCEYTQNVCLNRDIIYITEIKALFAALFGEEHIEKSMTRIETSQEHIKYLNSTICSLGFISPCSMSYAWVDERKDVGSYLDIIDACACLAPSARATTSTEASDVETGTRHWIYKNALDTTQLISLSEPLQDLAEFELVKDVCVKGVVGDYLFNNLHLFVGPHSNNHFSDLSKFMETVQALRPDMDFSVGGAAKDAQFIHTKNYVDAFKDDTLETVASMVMDKVHGYLQQVLEGKVNMNRIGMDLVELGVKKTRKAKGHVYGIKNPNKAEVAKLQPVQIVSSLQ